VVRGVDVSGGPVPDLLIEVPHGATRAIHFQALRAQLVGTAFPEQLIDFFFVNTDVGAPEAALALAAHVTRAAPHKSVAVVRALIPRTFIDCNRVVDVSAQGRAATTSSAPGGVTPGVVGYVTEAADLALLFARYSAYRAVTAAAFELVCDAGGTAVMLHSYAPRSVDVAVDEHIVDALHAAYRPEVEPTWPLRSPIDFITRTPDGALLADERLIAILHTVFKEAGFTSTEGSEYPLHPSTVAHVFASRWPRQTLLIELRRDLLVKQFTPFLEMETDPHKVDHLAGLLASGLKAWWEQRA
jgi:hypothetical protein